MKTPTILMTLALITASFSAHAGVRENGGFLVPAAAKLEFISLGAGIDVDLQKTVDALIRDYEEAGLVEEFTKNQWGMKGEVTVCVLLNELEASRELNRQLADLVRAGKGITNLEYVASCKENKGTGPFRRR
jgi:hypothetical protein